MIVFDDHRHRDVSVILIVSQRLAQMGFPCRPVFWSLTRECNPLFSRIPATRGLLSFARGDEYKWRRYPPASSSSSSSVYDAIVIKICNRADTLSFIRISTCLSREREARLTSRLYLGDVEYFAQRRERYISRAPKYSCRLPYCDYDRLHRRYTCKNISTYIVKSIYV